MTQFPGTGIADAHISAVLTKCEYLEMTVMRPVFGRLPGPNRAWLLFIFHVSPVSFQYTSHVTTMFTYQTPTRHSLLATQKRAYGCLG